MAISITKRGYEGVFILTNKEDDRDVYQTKWNEYAVDLKGNNQQQWRMDTWP